MENGGERPEVRRAMEDEGLATDLVMCSTCSGFVYRKERTSVPKPGEEVVREAEKMRDLLMAILLHGPLQEMEPAEATKKQWQVLRRRRRIMMETKRCPTCSGSPLKVTCSREGSEFMSLLRSLDGKVRMKTPTLEEAMLTVARSEQKLKRSREEGKRSSCGLKEKKAKSEDKEGSQSKKKAKRSSEMEGRGSKEAKKFYSEETKMMLERLFTNALDLLEQAPIKPKEEENSESAVGNTKTKMVTRRIDQKDIDSFKSLPPRKPLFYDKYLMTKDVVDTYNAHVAVESLFFEYLQCYCCIKGYAEFQEEVTDDEGDDHTLV